MDVIEKVSRAICSACDENPDDIGDARGSEKRWQDYIQVANAAISAIAGFERDKCANILNLRRSEASLMAGEMTAQEWRTVSAVLQALQTRMRNTN